MFNLYDKVRIKGTDITGLIVHVSDDGSFVVEDDVKGRGCPEDQWAWIDCEENELEKIE